MERDPPSAQTRALVFPARARSSSASHYYNAARPRRRRNCRQSLPVPWATTTTTWSAANSKTARVDQREWPGADGKVCCDIQPLMDKAWALARRVGLARQTHQPDHARPRLVGLSSARCCSTSSLPRHRARRGHCGSCTLCIEACPTHAITEPYGRGRAPLHLLRNHRLRAPELPARSLQRSRRLALRLRRVSRVCPWESLRAADGRAALRAARRGDLSQPLGNFGTHAHSYAARFRRSAVKRAKLSGLQRNARARRRRGPKSVEGD